MNISIEILLLAGSVLLLFSILLSKTGYRFGVPTLLMFLLAGMIFGTDGVGIEFDDVHTAQDIGMAALCIILFSGGLDTKIKSIRPVLWPGLSLSTAGVLLTTLITGGFSAEEKMMLPAEAAGRGLRKRCMITLQAKEIPWQGCF